MLFEHWYFLIQTLNKLFHPLLNNMLLCEKKKSFEMLCRLFVCVCFFFLHILCMCLFVALFFFLFCLQFVAFVCNVPCCNGIGFDLPKLRISLILIGAGCNSQDSTLFAYSGSIALSKHIEFVVCMSLVSNHVTTCIGVWVY